MINETITSGTDYLKKDEQTVLVILRDTKRHTKQDISERLGKSMHGK